MTPLTPVSLSITNVQLKDANLTTQNNLNFYKIQSIPKIIKIFFTSFLDYDIYVATGELKI